MRFSLVDLFIFIGVLVGAEFGALGLVGASSQVGLVAVMTFLATFVVIVVLPSVYRRFHLLPLRLPKCPHCRRVPPGYQSVEGGWPNVGVRCGACDGRLWLAFDRHASLPETASEEPLLVLQWPENLGFWRRA